MTSEAVDTRGQVAVLTPAEALGPLNETEQCKAPRALYLAGDRSLLTRAPKVAIVGSRQASERGLRRARRLAGLLVSEGVTVVSGLALGIDTAAHRGAIDAGGKTIAVLGTPLDAFYPKPNRRLQLRIMSEHLAVSQFAPGSPTTRKNFPMRNRTMALISDASVIVEAAEKSGSISQAWEALRLGRPLFLMRSLVEAGLSWPRALLDYGACVLSDETLEDLVASLPLAPPAVAF